jgi:hypothetical protein
MKKHTFFTSICLLFSFLLIISSCDLLDLSKDDCEDSKLESSIFKTFFMSVQVKYKDGTPFDGKTEFVIVKERCDGSQSGYQNVICTSDSDGIFTPNIEPSYTYNNKKDKVMVRFTAYHTPFYPPTEKTEVTGGDFNASLAESQSDENDEIYKTYSITIPTNADGTE